MTAVSQEPAARLLVLETRGWVGTRGKVVERAPASASARSDGHPLGAGGSFGYQGKRHLSRVDSLRSELEAFGGFGDSETLGIEILSRPG